MGKLFNNSDLSPDDPLVWLFQSYLNDYPDGTPKLTDDLQDLTCYIEEYQDNGILCSRLRDKKTDKKIEFWTHPHDTNADEIKKEWLEWLSETKEMNVDDLYKRNGKEWIIFQGYILNETNETIILSSYFSELFYQLNFNNFNA